MFFRYLTILMLVLAVASILLWAVFPIETKEFATQEAQEQVVSQGQVTPQGHDGVQ